MVKSKILKGILYTACFGPIPLAIHAPGEGGSPQKEWHLSLGCDHFGRCEHLGCHNWLSGHGYLSSPSVRN